MCRLKTFLSESLHSEPSPRLLVFVSFSIPQVALQQWEQGPRQPQGPARILLKVIAHNPKVVREALKDLGLPC